MTEKDYEFLREHLNGYIPLNSEEEDIGFNSNQIERLFDPSCGAWKVLYGHLDDTEDMYDYILLFNGFDTCFSGDFQKRTDCISTYRSTKSPDDRLPIPTVVESYRNLETRYLEMRRFIAHNQEYSKEQKYCYLVLMAHGMLSAFRRQKSDQQLLDYFIHSKLYRLLIEDHGIFIAALWGKALCKCLPDSFSEMENPEIRDYLESEQK